MSGVRAAFLSVSVFVLACSYLWLAMADAPALLLVPILSSFILPISLLQDCQEQTSFSHCFSFLSLLTSPYKRHFTLCVSRNELSIYHFALNKQIFSEKNLSKRKQTYQAHLMSLRLNLVNVSNLSSYQTVP